LLFSLPQIYEKKKYKSFLAEALICFKKAPYIPESQVLTERFEAYKRKQQEEKQG